MEGRLVGRLIPNLCAHNALHVEVSGVKSESTTGKSADIGRYAGMNAEEVVADVGSMLSSRVPLHKASNSGLCMHSVSATEITSWTAEADKIAWEGQRT